MRADSTSIVGKGERGRNSVRISSWNAYEESVIVLDLQHMPEGCATWPAFWTLSQQGPWPNGGEIDIVEGALYINVSAQDPAKLSIFRRKSAEIEPGYFAHESLLHNAAATLPVRVRLIPQFLMPPELSFR